MDPIESQDLTLKYDTQIVIDGLNLTIPKAQITVLVGSNGCGKSTLLKSFARLIRPSQGTVLLNGKDIHRRSTAAVARELAILPQSPTAPEGLSVYQLVRLGRYPHQTWLQQWSKEDETIVTQALAQTELTEFQDRPVDALSGGQRQRAWIAMTLAQNTDTLLLDEPTTYLDLAHQIEVLDLLFELNATRQKTIVMVLHDLNLACRYAHNMIAIANRQVYAQGNPAQVLNATMVQDVFHLQSKIVKDPLYGTPMCIPIGKGIQSAGIDAS